MPRGFALTSLALSLLFTWAAPIGQRAPSDAIKVGTLWRGSWTGIDGASNQIALVITRRDGGKLEGVEFQPEKTGYFAARFEGSVERGGKVSWQRGRVLTGPQYKARSVTHGQLEGDQIRSTWEYEDLETKKKLTGVALYTLAE